MPFGRHVRPSIQLGLLKPIAARHGFPTTTYHLNLDFAKQIGPAAYEAICDDGELFIGDWLFSLEAFGDGAPDKEARYLELHEADIAKLLAKWGRSRDDLIWLRQVEVPRYLDRLMQEIDWRQYRAVGFTSTFQQNAASFALAARIKSAFPEVNLIFGGANFATEMGVELTRSLLCVDYAVIGEGDRAFPALLEALRDGRSAAGVPGVVFRHGDAPAQAPVPVTDMDDLPLPDYDEYFERAQALDLLAAGSRRGVMIPFESARGCWWGQKHPCAFCSSNGDGMTFRSKSADRLQQELSALALRYGSFSFEAVDDLLDAKHFRTFLPELARDRHDFKLACEVKANLSRDQIKLLHLAGVRSIQPRMESLNSNVLKRMRKGASSIHNVNMLRWAAYYDLDVAWSLLYGFPGETATDYKSQEVLARELVHLQPPAGMGRIPMERFGPIYFDRISFPVLYARPHSSYQHTYPAHVDTKRIACLFDYQFEDSLPEATYQPLGELVDQWRSAWKRTPRPSLTFWATTHFLLIEDRRAPGSEVAYTFNDPLASLYKSVSDAPLSVKEIMERLPTSWSASEIEHALDAFCARGLMMRDRDQFLSLALPAVRGR